MKSLTNNQGKYRKRLYETMAALETAAECERFLTDLCTPGELVALTDRWRVAALLELGTPYREIYEKTGVSTATVTRIARCLGGGKGGYRLALEKIGRNANA